MMALGLAKGLVDKGGSRCRTSRARLPLSPTFWWNERQLTTKCGEFGSGALPVVYESPLKGLQSWDVAPNLRACLVLFRPQVQVGHREINLRDNQFRLAMGALLLLHPMFSFAVLTFHGDNCLRGGRSEQATRMCRTFSSCYGRDRTGDLLYHSHTMPMTFRSSHCVSEMCLSWLVFYQAPF